MFFCRGKKIIYLYSQMTPKNQQTQTLFAGGAQKKTYEVASYFSSRGFDVYLASDDYSHSKIVSQLKSSGIKHIQIPFRSGGLKQIECLFKLIATICYHRIGLIHSNDRWTAMFGRIASILTCTTMIYTARNIFNDKKLSHFFFGKHIIAVSQAVKNNLIDYFQVPPQNVDVIYNGTDIHHSDKKERSVIKEQFGLKGDNKLICVIGRLSEEKGLRYLFHALAVVVKKHPMLKVFLVGDGKLRNELIQLSKDLKVEDHIFFCGNRSDVAAFIDLCDFSVMPSLWEGMPGSVIESIMLGTPAVATSVGGTPEIIEIGVNGLLVPPKDSNELSKAICCMLDNPEMVQNMGKNAKLIAKKKFTLARMLTQYEEYYLNSISVFRSFR